VLKGAGVGDSAASAIAATVTWMLKDGAGMIGRILFAWLQGSALDSNAKQWRLVADVLNDAAIFIDLLAPLLPGLFLIVMCLSSISRSIVGVAGGATRAALTQHQALKDNMADVSAKDGSQETMVNFTALLVSLVLTPAVADKQNVVWMLFIAFTALHLFANWRAVKAVVMDTLNYNRFHQVVDMYLKGRGISPPEYINPRETLLPWSNTFLKMDLGCPLHTVLKSKDRLKEELQNYTSLSKKYILRLDCKQRRVFIALNAQCNDLDILQAVYHKEVLEYFMKYRQFSEVLMKEHLEPHSGPLILRLASMCFNGLATFDEEEEFVNFTGNLVRKHFQYLVSNLTEAGWSLKRCMLGATEWRYSWKEEEFHVVPQLPTHDDAKEDNLEEYH
jgi:hypothetical protein